MGVSMDGLSGALMAVESFSDGRAVLHGPGGCRNYHTALSKQSYPRSKPSDPIMFAGPYFMGQHRIPCTYLDNQEYVFGSREVLDDCVIEICSRVDGFKVFIPSPAAALIGDDINGSISRNGMEGFATAVDSSLISMPFSSSYDRTVATVLEWMDSEPMDTVEDTVNLIGLPITSPDWDIALEDLTMILSSMGIKVISAPGCGMGLKDSSPSTSAEYNVVVCCEYSKETARYYEKDYGIESISYNGGAPVGFDAILSWAMHIADRMDKNPDPVIGIVDAQKKHVYKKLSGSISSDSIRFKRFGIHADSSILLPLSKWLYDYMSMIPADLRPEPGFDDSMVASAKDFLGNIGMGRGWEPDVDVHVDYLFTDGNSAKSAEISRMCTHGVDISSPSLGRCNIIPRPVIGLQGARYILDEVSNNI